MPAGVQTRSTLGDLGQRGAGPLFESVFEENLVKYEGREAANQLFSFKNTDQAVVRTTGLTGFERLQEFEEGEPFPTTRNAATFTTTYTIRDYGQSVEVTDDMLKDRQRLGATLDEFAGLAKMSDVSEVRSAFQIIVGGGNTNLTSNGVSVHRYNAAALWNSSHSRADGGTAQSNTASLTLTELNLETARLALVQQLSDRGEPLLDMGTITLVVPQDLEKNAVIFTASEQRPSTTNNDLNYYRGRIGVISSKWLDAAAGGSATAWYLVARMPNADSPLQVYRQGAPEFKESAPEPRTWNRIFAIKHRYAVGYSHWLGTYRGNS